MTNEHLQALIDVLRSSGVTRYVTPELTLELLPKAAVHISSQPEQPEQPEQPSDDELLYWSAK